MIKDQDVYRKSSQQEFITKELIEQNQFIDYQGLNHGYHNRQLRLDHFIKNFRPVFGVLQEKPDYEKNHQDVDQGILDFNQYHQVNDVKLGHFQLHECVVALSNKDILYTSDRGLSHFDMVSGKNRMIMEAEKVESINYSKRLNMVTGCSNNTSIYVYDILNEKSVLNEKLIPQADLINGSIFVDDPSDSILACGNYKSVLHYDLVKKKSIKMIDSIHYVNQIAYKPDNKLIAFAMDDVDIQIKNLNDPQCNIILKGHEDYNFAVKFMDEYKIATGSQDVSTRIWDLRKPEKELHVLGGFNSEVGAFCYCPKRKVLFCCENFTYIYAYDFSESIIKRRTFDFFSLISGIALSPDGNSLFGGLTTYKNGIVKFDIKDPVWEDVE